MLTVAVLGRVRAERDGVPAPVPDGLTAALLVRLALDAGHPVRAERLVADLWPDSPGTRPNTLQAKVSQLRRALGDPGSVVSGAAGYTLRADRVDAAEALRLAETGAAQLAGGDPAGAAATCHAGLVLFGPEILVGAGDWAAPHRARLEEARLRLTEDGLAARVALGAAGELAGELEALVAEHPLRERLWVLLITALYRAGRPSDALAAHRRVTHMLAEELGVDPGPELAALERRVLVHDPSLAAPASGGAAATEPVPAVAEGGGVVDRSAPGNVPVPATPLIGRDAEVAALRAALAAHRLVTITGPAGVGKTRLAVEVAREGWLVRLDGVRAGAEVPAAVAAVVPGLDAAAVPAGLRGTDLLLVLDNCEHLVDAVAALAVAVLGAAPGVRVLATSQRSLGVDGEHVHPLAPLAEADAVALFVERAAARTPSFAAAQPAVARLCRALDGLPLAIELAAARTRILSVPEITARLGDRFALLADPTSARPERSRTLAAALSWSYDLLFPDDQRGLWALAAFPAGATLGALEHVLPALGVPAAAALDIVERLVDRSMATADPGPVATRYRLLDSVRALAAARATGAGAADAAADALVGWVAGLADGVATAVRGTEHDPGGRETADVAPGRDGLDPAATTGGAGRGQAEVVAATAAERATIEAALDRAHGSAAALRIAVGFGWAWVLLDDTAAPRRLRAARTEAAPTGLRVRGLLLEAWLEAMSGDLGAARSALDAAVALEEPALVDEARWYGGFVLFQEGRHAQARDDLLACREAFAASGERWFEGGSLLLAAFAHLGMGELAAARAACEEAIGIVEPLGDAWGLQHAESALGRVAQAEGRFADAARHHRAAAEAAERLGFPGAAALHLSHLGRARAELGDPAAAATLRAAADRAEEAGDLRLLATIRVALAQVVLAAGDWEGARTLLVAADRWFRAAGGGEGSDEAARLLAALDPAPTGGRSS